MNIERMCKHKPGCTRSLEGFRDDCEIHPDCRAEYNRILDSKRKEKEYSTYKNKLRAAFRIHYLRHPYIVTDSIKIARLIKEAGFNEYGYNAIYHHLRWDYLKRGLKVSMPNNYIPLYTDLVMEKARDLEDLFHTNTRKNS